MIGDRQVDGWRESAMQSTLDNPSIDNRSLANPSIANRPSTLGNG